MELRALLRLLWRRRKLMFWVFAVIFCGLALLTILTETQYVSSAKVYLYHSPTKASLLSRISLDSPMAGSASLTDTERSTYEDLAATVPVLRPVIRELHLTRKRKSLQVLEFIPFVRLLLDHFAPDLGRRPMTYEELTNKSLVHLIFPRPYIKAAMMESSDILEFSSSADSLELSIALANAAARSFVARETAMRQDECRLLAEAVDKELPKARAAFNQALDEQRDLRRREKIVDLSTAGEQLVTRYYTLTSDRDANRLSLIKARGMLANVKAQLAKRPEFRKTSESIQRSGLIDSVKLTLRDLYMDLASARTRMTAEHPAVKEIEGKIAEAKRIIKDEAQKVFGSETVSTDPTYSYLSERGAEYTAQVAGYESQDEAYETLLAALEKEAEAHPAKLAAEALVAVKVDARQTFVNNLNQLASMAAAGEGLDLSLAHMVEPATIPGKINDYMRPKLSLMLAVGVLLGGFLAVVAALVAAYADETVSGPAGALAAGTTPLGSVPRRDRAARAQALRRLREALYPAGADDGGPRLVVVAAAGGTVAPAEAYGLALDLGRTVARSGRATLVVDADLRQPGLYAVAGLPAGPGLAEALAGETPLASVLVPGDEQSLWILPAAAVPADGDAADRLMDGPALRRVLAELADRFDRVLVCAAPCSRSGDALALGRLAGAVALVAGLYRTPGAVLAQAASEVLAATGRTPFCLLDGAPTDDLTPREQWRVIRRRLRRAKAAPAV